jgi:hypothetical protein
MTGSKGTPRKIYLLTEELSTIVQLLSMNAASVMGDEPTGVW